MSKSASEVFEWSTFKTLDKTLTEYTGVITTIIYTSPKNDFMVAIFKEETTNETFKMTCQYVTDVDVSITIFGEWIESAKWGQQFKSSSLAVDLKLSKNGLVKFLAKTREISNIGEVKAKNIVEIYGDNFDEIITTLDPDTISKEVGIGIDDVINLQKVWSSRKMANQIAVNLSDYPLSQKHIMDLVKLYGVGAIDLIKENPYFLITILKAFGFKRADEIAMQNGIEPNSDIRKQACIEYILSEVENSGSCWMDRDFILDKMCKELTNVEYNDIYDFVADRVDKTKITKFEDDGIVKVSSKNIFDKEKYIIDYIINNSGSNETFNYEKGIDNDDLEILNEDQKDAVLNSLKYNFSVITGKAGTGKTFVISKIVEIFRRIGLTIACAAPTGKAARRMEELTNYPASTIHRLLKFNGEHFEYNENNKIEDFDVIIIDEFSMVSIELGYNLLSALPENTKVIIVGDHNQLAAIGAGNIFNDILVYDKINEKKTNYKISELSKVVRQAGNLKKNSVEILNGVMSHENTDDWVSSFTDQFEDDYKLSSFIVDMMMNTEKYIGYELRDVQLIVPMKKETLELSTYNLNKLLQKAIQYKKYGNIIEVTKYQDNLYLYDKVMQVANDYQIEVMNGTIGTVSYISDSGDITINFDGDVSVDYIKGDEKLKNVQLAYAMTTHKTQGSEYPCVIVVMHNSHFNMLNRNLLYTAVTRAKEKVMIFGDRKSIAIALSRDDTSDKKTNFMYHMR